MSSSSPCANRPKRRQALVALGALGALALRALPAAAQRPPPPELVGLALRGEGRLRYLGLRIYDIRLWSAAPQAALQQDWGGQGLALELQYARALKGRLIAERSLTEMRRQGEIGAVQAEAWLSAMTAAFPDVAEGDRLSGRYAPGEPGRFWFNGQPRSAELPPDAARAFFGIWLHPATSEAALRRQLLGLT